jgi:hypothetical protein
MSAARRGLAGGLVIAAMIAMLASCGNSHDSVAIADASADSAAVRPIDGAWTIELRAARLGFETLHADARGARLVRGELAFVRNHWIRGGEDLPRPTHYGSYDIDFTRLGFDPRHRGELPRVAARTRGRDSVDIVLEPDDPHESVQLHGAWRGASIVGSWSLEPVRAGGDAAGSFTMSRTTTNP